MRTLKDIIRAFLYHLARIFGFHRRRKSSTRSSSSSSHHSNHHHCHGNNNNNRQKDDLERQLPSTQLSLSDNNQRSENIQRPTDDRILDDSDDRDIMDDEDDDDDDSPPTCGCGRVLKQGWMCPDCRTNCPQCGRALGIDEPCDRCTSRQQLQ
ncbi:hypothetical protein BDA99DRAFT_516581 [Phascolomyces articulosus]|uniref:Uncharacterized protein n=1 Tax=Phascolomyces articulosus TaxID=60185 RepID=A0AAD5JVL3_9FUNG|nr:hypothetical protein BDA99DRAFT_516581 [Phascolomyces articulosus]